MAASKRKPTKAKKKSATSAKAKPRATPSSRTPRGAARSWIVSPDLARLDHLIEIGAVALPPGKGLECIAKNPIFELAEAKFNSLPNERREQFLRGLLEVRDLPDTKRVDGYVALCGEFQLLRGGAALRHVRDDWFGKYFSPAAVNIAIAAGIVATQRSLVSQLPIDCYWVAGPDKTMRFAISESSFQISVLLITPKLVGPETKVRQLERPERIWFTQVGADGQVTMLQNHAVGLERG